MITLVKTAGIHFTAEQPFLKAYKSKDQDKFILNFSKSLAFAHLSGRLDIVHRSDHPLFLSDSHKYFFLDELAEVTVTHHFSEKSLTFSLPEGTSEKRALALIHHTLILIDSQRGISFRGLRSSNWAHCTHTILLEDHAAHEKRHPVAFAATCAQVNHCLTGMSTRATRVLMFHSPPRGFTLEILTSTFGLTPAETQLELTLDYDSHEPHLLAQYDKEGSVVAVVTNSTYLFYTQLLLLNPLSGKANTYKLHSLLAHSDLPCRSGREQLKVDDMAWSPDNNYLALFLNNGYFCLFHRGGQPLSTVVSVKGCSGEPNLISYVPFATDPHTAPAQYSVSWEDELILSDGFNLAVFRIEGLSDFDEMAAQLTTTKESNQVSMSLSNLTKPLPTDIEDNKGALLESILMLLKSSWSKIKNFCEENGRLSVLAHLEGIYQNDENKQEISYVNVSDTNNRLESSDFRSGIILSKRISILEAFTYFMKYVDLQKWALDLPIDSFEATVIIADQVLVYTLSDGQAIYGYLIIRLLEELLGMPLYKLRSFVLLYTLIHYKNHQASNMNIIYYPIAFKLHRDSVCVQLPEESLSFLISFLNSKIQGESVEVLFKDTPTTFRTKDTADFYSSGLSYLRDKTQSFENKEQILCISLLLGNMQAARYATTAESLLVMAYYLDPTEPLFVSPLEIRTVTDRMYPNVDAAFDMLNHLSNLEVPADPSYAQDAGFLYWVTGKFDKLEALLGTSTALLAIASVLTKISDKAVAAKTLDIMKKLFAADISGSFSFLEEDVMDLFLNYGLDLMQARVKELSLCKGWTDYVSCKPFSELVLPHGAARLIKDAGVLLQCFYIDLTRLSVREWVKFKHTSPLEAELIKKAKILAKLLWVLYLKTQFHATKDSRYLIRLARWQPHSVRIRKAVVDAVNLGKELELIGKVIPLNYFDGVLTEDQLVTLKEAYEQHGTWKQDSLFTKFLYDLFSGKEQSSPSQKKFVFPGISDDSQPVDNKPEQTIKTWTYLKRTLFQEYGLEEPLEYMKGRYITRKTRTLDLANLFNSGSPHPSPKASHSYVADSTKPLQLQRPRVPLQFTRNVPTPPSSHSSERLAQLACKEIGIVLQKLLINRYLYLKEQILLGYKTVQRGHRRISSMPSYPHPGTSKLPKVTEGFYLIDPATKKQSKCDLTFSSTAAEGLTLYRFKT